MESNPKKGDAPPASLGGRGKNKIPKSAAEKIEITARGLEDRCIFIEIPL
jgi:hypothetical protein